MAETEKPKTTAAKKSAAKPKSAASAKPKAAAAKKPAAAKSTVAKRAPAAGKTENVTVNKVKEDVNNFKAKATDSARAAAEKGKDRASEAANSIGKLIRDSAATIDEKVGTQYGDYARGAADAVDGFASKLDAKDVDDIVTDTRDFIRKSPAVAIGAAAAIGFVLARLVRSGTDDKS